MKSRTRTSWTLPRRAIAFLSVATLGLTMLMSGSYAAADNITISDNTLRTGWDANEPGLAPSSVSSSDFGQLFSTAVSGQVYAQPISVAGTLVIATENNNIYGLNPVNGAQKWSRQLGAAWPAATLGCGDLVPTIGITSTPVVDPATGTLYLTSKVNDGADAAHPHWYMHAIDPATGAERAGWPVVIKGSPTNDPTRAFNPETAMQRPGLLLLGGVVYAGFASHCDTGPYVGYVVGVNTKTPSIATMWSTEAGHSTAEAGIWQSGGGLVSDGPGRIIFTTGNGLVPPPGPGNKPPTNLGEAVVRLQVGANGTLTARDFFSPTNNTGLNTDDFDLGSGGPMAIPDGYGTAAHPHLLVQIGKDGRLFLLDRDNLGGTGQGPNGTDAAVSVSGPYEGVWGHPAFWGGSGSNGGYVYTVETNSYLRASKLSLNASGVPTLVSAATSPDTFGYTSGSPVVTSNGNAAGSALVWVIRTASGNGAGGQLRVYDALPRNGIMHVRYSVSIGTAAKFAVVATDGGRVYLGTRDGRVMGFGRPAASALTAAPVDFGSVPVGTKAGRTLTVTATKAVTVSGVATAAPFTATLPAAPVHLAVGQTLAVPVTLTPTVAGAVSGTATFTTSAGPVGFDLNGEATKPGLAALPASINFGTIPTGANVTLSVNIVNTGATAATVTSSTAPAKPFAAASLPKAGTSIPSGGSIAISVTYAPTVGANSSGSIKVSASTGSVTVPLAGVSVNGGPRLTIAPRPLDFGATLLGTTTSANFNVSDTGNTNLTITKAAPPVGAFNTTTPIAEGQQIVPGDSITQNVTFTPSTTGVASAAYLITGNDGRGPQNEAITGVAGVTGNLIGKKSGRCATVANPLGTAGSAVQLGNCAGAATQAFRPGASNTLTSLGNCLAASGTANGSLAVLRACTGSGPQQWQVTATGLVKNIPTGLCLTPTGLGTAAGTRLEIATCSGVASQVWLSPHRTGTIIGQPSGRCLDVVAAGTADRTPVDIFTCNGSAAQSWSIAASGTLQVLGKCLDVKFGAITNGAEVWLFTCNGTAAQQWRLQASGALLNPHSGRCLAPVAGGATNGTTMQLAACKNAAPQLWLLH